MKQWKWMAVFAATTMGAWAGPFNPADVPEEAVWYAHLDVDQLKRTETGTQLLAQMEMGRARAKLSALQVVFNFELRKDLSGLTVCGAGSKNFALLRGRFDPDRLIGLLAANDGYETTIRDGYTIHSWLDENRAKKMGTDQARMYGAFHDSGTVLISDQADVLGHELAVLDGKKPSIAVIPPTVPGMTPFLVGTVTDLSAADSKNAILKLTTRGTVSIGEDAGNVKGYVSITAVDLSSASNVVEMARGMRALLVLNQEKNPRLARLADSARVTQNGENIELQLEFPSADLAQAIHEKTAGKPDPKAK